MKSSLIKYGVIALVIGGIYVYNKSSDPSSVDNYIANDIDLNAVLDVTIDTIYSYEESLKGQVDKNPDNAFIGFTEVLATNYNSAQPALHSTTIGTSPQNDASVLAFEDSNQNQQFDETENALFLVEIDGENSRIVASSQSGAVNEHRFSGTGLLAGFLLGSMLNRQKASGASSRVASKKPVTASQAARARAGSGSHSRGK